MLPLVVALVLKHSQSADMETLRSVALDVASKSCVLAGGVIPGSGTNSTGTALHIPGGTQNYYPAFWIRDAAMMLGDDFVPPSEIQGWVKLVASVQPGEAGLSFSHGLKVPAFSIPDHITLQGAACWYPGAYADQGVGDFGFLPPSDDAFYFVQMVEEAVRKGGSPMLLKQKLQAGWGAESLIEICQRAFDSVAVDPGSQLVSCSADKGKGRVDWGFCDSITKTGLCLMPSLLRWQAARRLEGLLKLTGDKAAARKMTQLARRIQQSVSSVFYHPFPSDEAILLSATGVGFKADVWASAFAVWLGILPKDKETKVARNLLTLVRSGSIVRQGQVRHIPDVGAWGGNWEQAKSAPGTYQNGGYWATPTGWLVSAIHKVDPVSASNLLHEYVEYLRQNRSAGAPFEWINPDRGLQANANYGSSAVLVYISLKQAGL